MKKREASILLFLAVFLGILAFAGAFCIESWACTDWSECNLEGEKTRNCTEINLCNTTADMPSMTRACGTNCTVVKQCMDWNPCINKKQTRICYNTNTCGAAEQKLLEWQVCTPSNETAAANLSASQAENSTVNNTAENQTEQGRAYSGECEGCVLEDRCYSYGERFEYDGKPRYCDAVDSKAKTQKMRNLQGKLVSCANNYECQSNVCADKKCFDLEELLSQAKSSKKFRAKFICWFASLFKSSDYEQCIYEKLSALNNTSS